MQAVHGPGTHRPDQEQAGIRRQVGRVVAGDNHDRGGNRGVPLRHVAQPLPTAQAGSFYFLVETESVLSFRLKVFLNNLVKLF